jgi:hypothetical protein
MWINQTVQPRRFLSSCRHEKSCPGSFRLMDQFVGAAEPGQYGREGSEIIKLIHWDGKGQAFNPGSHARALRAGRWAQEGAPFYPCPCPRKTRRPAVQFELPLAKYSISRVTAGPPFNGLNDSPIAAGRDWTHFHPCARSANWFNFPPACKLAVDGNSQRWALCLIPTIHDARASFSPREGRAFAITPNRVICKWEAHLTTCQFKFGI